MTRDDIIDPIKTFLAKPTNVESIERLVDHFDLMFTQKDARIDELLQVINEYLERARAAERLNKELLISIAGCARLIGQFAPLIDVDK
jgi:hypothetical protein